MASASPAEPQSLQIPAEIRDAMVAHCRDEAPLEACGLLGGIAPRVSSIHRLRNVAASEVRYRADPLEVIEANRTLRHRGAEILAIYHSHPRTEPVPSRTDLRDNHWEAMPHIIVSFRGSEPEVRAWRLDPDSYQEIPWSITPGSD